MAKDKIAETGRNLLLVFLLLAVTLATAFQEGFLTIGAGGWWPKIHNEDAGIFWVVFAGSYSLVFWLAFSISTRRLIAFMVAILLVEYFNQTLGTKLGLWEYVTTPKGGYLFGVCTWVGAGLFAYMFASKAVVRLSMKAVFRLPKVMGVLLVMGLLGLIYWAGPANLLRSAAHGCDQAATPCLASLFWLLFSVLTLIGIAACLTADPRMVLGVVISAWVVGFISESAGGIAHLWSFGSGPSNGPSVYLVGGMWPLEVLAQFAISAWIAGESLVVYSEHGCSDAHPDPDNDPDNDPDSSGRSGGAGPTNGLTKTDSTETGSAEGPGEDQPEGSRADSSGSAGAQAASDSPVREDGADSKAVTTHHEGEPPPPEPRAVESDITDAERVLKWFLILSGITYLVVGFIFAIIPAWVDHFLADFNIWHPDISLEYQRRLYVGMSFSMMMCITFLAFYAAYDIRKNKLYVIPLLIAKASSALSGLAFFVFVQHSNQHLVLFLVDGALFALTAHFFIQSIMGWLKAQTDFFKDDLGLVKSSGPTVVAVYTGDNKFELLDKVLKDAGFFKALDKRFQEVKAAGPGITKETFRIAIKPNFMFMHAKKDFSTYTDPELVKYLVDRLWDEGYRIIDIVEAQSTLGNYYAKRDVKSVAGNIGYEIGPCGRYRVVDLTKDMVQHNYEGKLGWHYAGRAWKEADFRISFAKHKTHLFCTYTLTLKNVYGTLPMQNKLKYYHVEREYDWATIESMKPGTGFPVHFGLVDAFYSADGEFGILTCPNPRHTKTIYGGENLMAVDGVGCWLMGLNPNNFRTGRYYRLGVKTFGRPKVTRVGNGPERFEPWDNVNLLVIDILDVLAAAYHFSDWAFSIITACSKDFPLIVKTPSVRFLRWVLKPIKGMYYKYDAL